VIIMVFFAFSGKVLSTIKLQTRREKGKEGGKKSHSKVFRSRRFIVRHFWTCYTGFLALRLSSHSFVV